MSDIPMSDEQCDAAFDDTFDKKVRERYRELKIEQEARNQLAGDDLPPFTIQTLDEVLREPPPEWVLPGVLSVGVHGIAGPPEAGKSLVIRDMLDSVANGTPWRGYTPLRPRNVTYVIGEGRSGLVTRFSHVETGRISVSSPINLVNPAEVDRFLKELKGTDQGLIAFDMIYQMGISDENVASEMTPLLKASRYISDELQCAVLLSGHPGHNGERRFRGSSSLRGFFDNEFHMAGGTFTCEKMKDGDAKHTLRGSYRINYPHVEWLTPGESLGDAANVHRMREMRIQQELDLHPNESARSIAKRLAPELGVSTSTVERIIREMRQGAANQ